MEIKERKKLEVSVDKRHIVSIGERLYTESVELLRELVNNAYDADATEVHVDIHPDEIVVKDNGTGMDLEGLKQYFIIGSEEKIIHSRSPKYGRIRIGQFGIGKFASLAAASRFEVITQHKDFAARVVFDKKDWEKARDQWHLPCAILSPDPERGDGTTVILSELSKSFQVEDVEKKLMEGVPLKAPDFAVYLNKRRLFPRSFIGQRIPIMEGTRYGLVSGEIIITPKSKASLKDLGIDIKVKGATIKKELFGMETWGKVVARIKGEINADFLPITSDRSSFVTDSDQYQQFLKIMVKVVGIIKKTLGKEADRRDERKASRAVREALQRIHKALAHNPDLSPFGPIPYGEPSEMGGGAVSEAQKKKAEKETELKSQEEAKKRAAPQKKKRRHPLVKRITPNAIVRRMRMGKESVSVCLDFFGDPGPECFSEGNVVYINRDHPLYKRESRRAVTYTMYIGRLITQEISMMKTTISPRVAFNRQSQLLKDAFTEE
ncbi:MAG: ATP-binding protein [Candidatus Aminicenantes bacterium]